jgi:hypothetical protein
MHANFKSNFVLFFKKFLKAKDDNSYRQLQELNEKNAQISKLEMEAASLRRRVSENTVYT